ncbi:MAG: Ig-like domain-containing protein [Pyrinomonadaceae bacterium]
MRRNIILAFFVCVFCPTLCFSVFGRSPHEVRAQNTLTSRVFPHFEVLFQPNFSKTAKNDFPNIFRPIGDLFNRILGRRRVLCVLRCNGTPIVNNLILSLSEITTECPKQNQFCSNGIKVIAVFAAAKDPEDDVLTYLYTVSSGKIIGQGKKILWDLSGVKAGTYTIKAEVDDGCGFSGQNVTKTVTVKECPDCKNE